jgi:hypothetical protein
MPRIPIDYSKTIIYKIACNDLNITDQYISSTTDFINTKSKHKSICNGDSKDSNRKIYKIIRNNGGWDNWSMIQIEEYPCANGNEAKARARYWIESDFIYAKLNVKVPLRTREEYRKDNKEEITTYNKKYNEDHKDALKEKRRQNREKNRDEINRKKREAYHKKKEQNKAIVDK